MQKNYRFKSLTINMNPLGFFKSCAKSIASLLKKFYIFLYIFSKKYFRQYSSQYNMICKQYLRGKYLLLLLIFIILPIILLCSSYFYWNFQGVGNKQPKSSKQISNMQNSNSTVKKIAKIINPLSFDSYQPNSINNVLIQNITTRPMLGDWLTNIKIKKKNIPQNQSNPQIPQRQNNTIEANEEKQQIVAEANITEKPTKMAPPKQNLAPPQTNNIPDRQNQIQEQTLEHDSIQNPTKIQQFSPPNRPKAPPGIVPKYLNPEKLNSKIISINSRSDLSSQEPQINQQKEPIQDSPTKKIDTLLARIDTDEGMFMLRHSEANRFPSHRHLLLNQGANGSESNSSLAWLELILLYLNHGWHQEAEAAYSMLQQNIPEIDQNYRAKFLHSIIKSELGTASNLQNEIKLDQLPPVHKLEAEFLLALLPYNCFQPWLIQDSATPTPTPESQIYYHRYSEFAQLFKENQNNFLNTYPRNILADLGLTLAKILLSQDNLTDTDLVLRAVNSIPNLSKEQQTRYLYTKAKLSQIQQNFKDSATHLKNCVLLNTDLAKSWCGSQLSHLNYTQKEISVQQHLDNIEQISLRWRNDIIEWDALEQISTIQTNNDNYSAAMDALKKIAKYIPSPVLSAAATNNMGIIFRKIFEFQQPNSKTLSPLEAVAFFEAYSDYIPIGTKGDEIVTKVIDNFVALDMLDQAEALLKHQINNRAFEYRKELFINKLAEVYLANLKPKEALELLTKNGDDWKKMYHTMSQARKIIYARVLLANGKHDDVVSLLAGDYSEKADAVLAHTYWDMGQWASFNENSEPTIYRWRNSKEKLNSKDMTPLTKQILGYYLGEEKDLLNGLMIDFQQRFSNDQYGEFSNNVGAILTLPSEYGVDGMQDLKEWRILYEQVKNFDGTETKAFAQL